jgi:hypothetical protein
MPKRYAKVTQAIKKMDGFLIKDQPLKVSNVPYSYSMLVGSTINMDEENGGFIGSAEARNLLIQKFSMRGRSGLPRSCSTPGSRRFSYRQK